MQKNQPYTIHHTGKELISSSPRPFNFYFPSSLPSADLVFLIKNTLKIFLWLISSAAAFLFFLGTPFNRNRIASSLEVAIQNWNKNQFIVRLGLAKNVSKVRRVRVNYTVIEEVTERSENVTNTHHYQIFKSPDVEKYQLAKGSEEILDVPELAYDFVFDFPKEAIPTSLNLRDARIIWRVHIVVYFALGLTSHFVKDVEVGKLVR